ncbi:putative GNAT family acetyltransferase [Stachybotrys elegans]|uniref:GNAT family acetyltransferase n=1 Tax=Stachybotrys elegans TaxID=80388 RepID=A0A8K0SM06_9HYPO|nr:putative GNAT family acetyltransferase [Stachybotrys elegans]
MPLQVRPADARDAQRAAAIESAAYGPSPISHVLFPGSQTSDEADADAAPSDRPSQLVHDLAQDSTCRWVKVVDTDLEAQGHDGMVAFSMWYVYESPRAEGFKLSSKRGPGSNEEACELFFGAMVRRKHERLGSQPHAYLKLLHTDPAHQRRGAGSMLLRWGAGEADRLGIPSYLEASPEGRPLYQKHGFVEVDMLDVDFSRWGGPASFKAALMLRPAHGGGGATAPASAAS